MARNIDWDLKEWYSGLAKLQIAIQGASKLGVYKIGNEVLRLSSFEVPHDIGSLQSSATTEPVDDTEIIIGYNKVYAARLHEHPEYRFQKGRKGKYLEDPIKHNLTVFKAYLQQEINEILNGGSKGI